MDMVSYTNSLSNRLNSYFKIKYNDNILSENLDIFAKSQLILGRTMISKKDIIDKFESNEFILVKYYDSLSDDKINNFLEYIKNTSTCLVKPHIEHKSSYINAVIVCDKLPEHLIIDKIKSFKFEKIYKFYFHGFSEVRLFLVSLSDNMVISNKAGKKLKKVYLPTS